MGHSYRLWDRASRHLIWIYPQSRWPTSSGSVAELVGQAGLSLEPECDSYVIHVGSDSMRCDRLVDRVSKDVFKCGEG